MLSSLLISSEIKFKENESMSLHTTMKIGGKARYFITPENTKEIVFSVNACKDEGIPFVIAGNLSNSVFSDGGYDGAVISTLMCKGVKPLGDDIICECGAGLSAVAYYAYKNSLSGLEFSYGIPGTVGGALVMNAGAYGSDISTVAKSVEAYDHESGKTVNFSVEDCEFSYRHSVFSSGRYVVLSAVFALEKDCKEKIKSAMDDFTSRRKEKQPLDMPSAGSVFKRPEGRYVGQMIEELGLKGFSVGGACVSTKHAGFIVNNGGATCADLKKLIEIVKEAVYDKYSVRLECEIKFID